MNSLICSLAIVYILGFCLRQLQWSGNGADTLHFGRREFRDTRPAEAIPLLQLLPIIPYRRRKLRLEPKILGQQQRIPHRDIGHGEAAAANSSRPANNGSRVRNLPRNQRR